MQHWQSSKAVLPSTCFSPCCDARQTSELQLARKAKKWLPNIAVLFTSGYTDNAILRGGQLDEELQLLMKPYTREELARKLRRVLRKLN